jgi:hypothetical protein
LESLKAWLETESKSALPKSPLGVAIGYVLNRWEAFLRYTEEGYLSMDNVIAPYYTSYVGWRVLGSYLTSGSALLRSA